jgi:chromosome segregation ATPase
MKTAMESEKYETVIADLQVQPDDEPGNPSAKKMAALETENKQLKARVAADENEIKKLKEKITEIDFENRSLTTKNAAIESENDHLEARLNELDTIKEGHLKQAQQAGKNIPVTPPAVSHVHQEITYPGTRTNKLGNLKGWMSLAIVLLITTLVLIFLNSAYRI